MPATHSSRSPSPSVPVQTVPRTPRRCTMRCGTPRNGTTTPSANGAALRQPPEPRRDPAAVLLRELARLLQRAARRNGEHHFARRRLDAQRIAARLPVPAHAHEIDRAVEDDLDRLRLTWPAIKQRTLRHGGRPQNQPGADSAIIQCAA